jgi:hypothetical protein
MDCFAALAMTADAAMDSFAEPVIERGSLRTQRAVSDANVSFTMTRNP